MEKIEISEEALKYTAQDMEEELSLIHRSVVKMEMWIQNQGGETAGFLGDWFQQIEDCLYRTQMAEAAYSQLAEHVHHAVQSYVRVQEKAVQMVEDL